MIRPFRGLTPQLDPSVYVAPNASIIGDVHIGPRSSVWFGAVIRGDVFHIRIGSETSIQDNTVVHVTHDRFATVVGNRAAVGFGSFTWSCESRFCMDGGGEVRGGSKEPKIPRNVFNDWQHRSK